MNECDGFMSTHFDLILKRLTKMIFYEFENFPILRFFASLLLQEAEKRKNFEGDTF